MAIRTGAGQRQRGRDSDIFTDLLFNILIGVMILFVIALVYVSPEKTAGKINIDAQYLITVTWPDGNPDDIDSWVQEPNGEVLWFRNKNVGLLHLDRDDRGMKGDTIEVSGQFIENPLNQEVTTIRGIAPGEYVVNVHYYETETRQPVEVSVRVARVNPVFEIVYYGKLTLTQKGEEKTAVRFTLAADGAVTNINRLPKSLVSLVQTDK
jgi:hypothetical protein